MSSHRRHHPSKSKPSTSSVSSSQASIEDLSDQFHQLLDKSSETPCPDASSDPSDKVDDIESVLTKVNDTVKSVKSKTSASLIVDAEIVGSATQDVLGSANTMDMGEGEFNFDEWVEAYASKAVSEGDEAPITSLAKASGLFIRPTIPLGWSPINGGFELSSDEIPEKAEKKKRQPAQKKEEAAAKTEPEKTVTIDNADQEVERDVKIVYKKLRKHFKINKNQPLDYFKFVLHPTDYGETGRNIFHVSFLVRDGFAKLESHNNILFISPLKPDQENAGQSTSSAPTETTQFILSLDFKDWQALVALHDLQEPMI